MAPPPGLCNILSDQLRPKERVSGSSTLRELLDMLKCSTWAPVTLTGNIRCLSIFPTDQFFFPERGKVTERRQPSPRALCLAVRATTRSLLLPALCLGHRRAASTAWLSRRRIPFPSVHRLLLRLAIPLQGRVWVVTGAARLPFVAAVAAARW